MFRELQMKYHSTNSRPDDNQYGKPLAPDTLARMLKDQDGDTDE